MKTKTLHQSRKYRKLKEEVLEQLKDDGILEGEWKHDAEYIACVSDLLVHPVTRSMAGFCQHGNTTTLDHCLSVSYVSFKICKNLGLDYRSAARGGLLHDLFLYDWHTHAAETGEMFHGFTHPRVALNNADRYFKLNEKERDIILKHMWPLTVVPPKEAEGFVIMYADKYCSLAEVVLRIRKRCANLWRKALCYIQ